MLIVTIPLLLSSLALQLSVPGTIMIAYASTNVTGNNETEDVPNLVSTPPPLLPSIDKIGDADLNGTNTTQVRQPTGNYTNDTALVTDVGRRQIVTNQSATIGQNIPPTQPGQIMDGINVTDISNLNITKEDAVKAEQEANVMLENYNKKVEQEKSLEAVRANQTLQSSNTSSAQTCLGGELSVQIEKTTVCLSPYEISIACNPGGSLVGDPICASAGTSSLQQPLGEQPGVSGEQEVIDETQGQGPGPGEEEPGGGEEEVIEEGDAGEQEVLEDFE